MSEGEATNVALPAYLYNLKRNRIPMRRLLKENAVLLGSIPRTLQFYQMFKRVSPRERLRIFSLEYGYAWLDRLYMSLGKEKIMRNRPTWLEYYRGHRGQTSRLIDPRATELQRNPTTDVAIKELAIYAGVGYAGYQHILGTFPRSINLRGHTLRLGSRVFQNIHKMTMLGRSDLLSGKSDIEPEEMLRAYSAVLIKVFHALRMVWNPQNMNEKKLSVVVEILALLLCGAHQSCERHRSRQERTASYKNILIIANCAYRLASQVLGS